VAHAVVGGFARAVIRGESGGARLTVPRSALVTEDGEAKVYVYDDGKARLRAVQAAAGSGEWVEIQDGLRAGERVVTEGAAALSDGVEVRLKPASSVASPAGAE